MARETKVGLLAGLAFIVGFAIILTNQGQPRTQADLNSGSTRQAAAQSSSNRPSPTTTSNTRTRTHAGRSASRRNNRSTPRLNPARSSNAQRARSYQTNKASHAGSVRPGQSRETKIGQNAKPTDASNQTNLTGQPRPQVNRRAAAPSSTPQQRGSHQSGDNNLRQLELRIAQLTSQLETAKKGSVSPVQRSGRLNANVRSTRTNVGTVKPNRQSKSESLKYVVVAGDTLSKIAKTYYGHGSKRYIDQIIDANRSVLANPNVVRVGDELFLPGVPVVNVRAAGKTWRNSKTKVAAATPQLKRTSQPDHRSKNRTRKKSSTPAAWKWYEIKKNDRYISIAREQLGDAKRWPEIHRLNKDKFSDPSRIRVGVRIKLPTITLAQATQEQSH